jgi:hypothetical protein
MMTYNDVLRAVISHRHGGMVADQFWDVINGEPVEGQNRSAVRDIRAELARIVAAFGEDGLALAADEAGEMFA